MKRSRKQAIGLETIGLLGEPTRRRLYEYVVGEDGAVSREAAAEGTGIPVHTVKFHLDKLVEAGLLEVEFHKLTGRTGPGSGRPSKHYRRSSGEFSVEVPPRRYELLTRVLTDAIVESSATGEPVAQTARRAAFDEGRALGERHADPDVEPRRRVLQALREGGYEPSRTEVGIVLRNCPFHKPAQHQPALVCGLNVDFVSGLLEGAGVAAHARLDPAEGRCCVSIVGVANSDASG